MSPCYKLPEISQTLTPHPPLRLLTYPFVSSSPQGLHDLNVLLRQGRPRLKPLALMTIFGKPWVTDNAP